MENDANAPLILVAEDEVLIRRVVQLTLENEGYRVTTTENGYDCIEALKQGLQPALIMLDLTMPVMDGLETLKHLRDDFNFTDLPIVVFTAHNESQIVKEAVKLGAWDYLIKPFDPAKFAKRISDLVFKVDETELRIMIGNLRMKDESVFSAPGMKRFKDQPVDAYLTIDDEKSLCIILPAGSNPGLMSKLGEQDFREKVQIFNKCAAGWRKVWPRYSFESSYIEVTS